MNFHFNPYRVVVFAVLIAAYSLYLWVRHNVHFDLSGGSSDAFRPIHVIAGLAILFIALVGVLKLWINSRKDPD